MHRRFNLVEFHFIGKFQLLFMLLFTFTSAFSQLTVVQGKVTDKETGRPIPYVTILFKKTPIGTTTDSLGGYKLTSKIKVDSIQFTTIGYLGKTYGIKPYTTNELQVGLQPDLIKISEVTVLPNDGPVRRILKEMVDRKRQNNPAKYPRYSYRKYTKWEYHLNNVGPKMINSKAFKNNQSVFKTSEDSSKFLPIYFSEQLVYNEVQKNPSRQKSTVLADKTSGVGVLDDYEISGYTSALDMFPRLMSVLTLASRGWKR